MYGTDFLFPTVAAGTGKLLMGEPGELNHGLIMAQDVESIVLDDSWDVRGKVFEALVSEVYRSNSLATLNTMSYI